MRALWMTFRSLARSPRYAVVASLLIAIGLGACTTVFSLLDSLLLRDRPGIADPARLVDLGRSQNGGRFDNLAFADYLDLRADSRTLVDLAALRMDPTAAGLIIDREAEAAQVQWVTSNFLHVLGTGLARGRDFTQGDKPAPEIILSDAYWRKRFNADPAIVGRTVVFNKVGVLIAGVTEPGFTGNSIMHVDFWAPLNLWGTVHPGDQLLTNRANIGFLGLGRLRPGVTLAQSQSELSLIARRLEKTYPGTNEGRGVIVQASSRLPGEFGEFAGVFLGLLGALALMALVVACTNIGGLMLARATLRRRELAVRAAIGADRAQLVRMLLGEHLALFAVGAAGGLLLSLWLVELFRIIVSHLPFPVNLDVTLSIRAAGFAFGAALLAGLACGLGPALRGTRFDLLPTLRQGEQPAGARFWSLRNIFLTVQLTVSLALLVTAALLASTLQRLATANPGYDFARVESVPFDFSIVGLRDAPASAFRDALVARLLVQPQVESAAWSVAVPLDGNGSGFGSLRLPGAGSRDVIRTDWNLISPGYFETLRLPLVDGRNFTAEDTAGAPLVAIVNETLAHHTWPGRNPVGEVLVNEDNQPVTVIGVARNATYRVAGEASRNFVYCPIAQLYTPRLALFVRSRDGASIAALVREDVRQLQPGLPVAEVQRLENIAATGLLPFRIAAAVAAAAGLLALLLSGTGVYATTLFWASIRTREFGVRLALGATFGQLARFAIRGSLRTLAVAAVGGLLVAVALTRLASAALTDISPNPLVVASTTALFATLVTIAAWLPARRAARVDPIVALRAE